MFVLEFSQHFRAAVDNAKWVLLGCASFEERCKAVAAEVASTPPISATFLEPIDTGSYWETKCLERQRKHQEEISSLIACDTVTFPTTDPDAQEHCIAATKDLVAKLPGNPSDCLVVDISAMPKACFFPVLKYVLKQSEPRRVFVTYTEPVEYAEEQLHTDPILPAGAIAGFNFLVPGESAALAWIPILGFGSFFAEHIYEALVATGSLEHRVFPLVGFPGFDPSLYHRMLCDNGETMLELMGELPQIRDQFFFAPASDPFATKDAILATMKLLPNDVRWVGSPLGPRPMALGMLLAALEREFTILTCQARSYNPNYSRGSKRTHLFPVR